MSLTEEEGMNIRDENLASVQREEVYYAVESEENEITLFEEISMKIFDLCEGKYVVDEDYWHSFRNCLKALSREEAPQVLEQLGEFARCPLHFLCMKKPPADIVGYILKAAPSCIEWRDTYGCIPLHLACASGASTEVLQSLIALDPETTSMQDNKGRTPLHLGLNFNSPVSVEAIKELTSAGAAKIPDTDNGMIPLHYASACAVCPEILRTLIVAYPRSTTVKDSKGRVALHLVMSNGDGLRSAALVTNIVSVSPETVNMIDNDGHLPLHLFAMHSRRNGVNENNMAKCLQSYLNASPYATADFLTAMQGMKSTLKEVAVLTPFMHTKLNQKIVKRIPSAILMLDFYFQVLRIVVFTLGVNQSIDIRASGSKIVRPDFWIIATLYGCAGYFIAREVVQVVSLYFLNLFKNWLHDVMNWFDILTILINVGFAAMMQYTLIDDDLFQIGSSLSIGILWISTLIYIKAVNIELSVFIGGCHYIIKNLLVFLAAAVIFLFAFAQMFHTLYSRTEKCEQKNFFFCDLPHSFVKSVDFMLGNLDDKMVSGDPVGIVIFILYEFFIIIILSTVLIAIVTDHFTFIKGERAALVFWSNRLDYVAEMEAITNGPWKRRLVSSFMPSWKDEKYEQTYETPDDFESSGRRIWDNLMRLYKDEHLHVFSLDFIAFTILRIGATFFIGLVVIPLGLITAGVLWPPQIREYLFVANATHDESSASEIEELKQAMKELVGEVSELRNAMEMKTINTRNEIANLKSDVNEMQVDIRKEVKLLKDLALHLVEQKAKEDGKDISGTSKSEKL